MTAHFGSLGEGSVDDSILRAGFSLANQLGLDTVAEGVETHEQLQMVKAMGGSRAQGFHLAMPMDAGTLEDLLRVQGMLASHDPQACSVRMA